MKFTTGDKLMEKAWLEPGNVLLMAFILLLSQWILTGCDGDDNQTPPGSESDLTLLAEDAVSPRWFPDGERFLFAASEGSDIPAVYVARLDEILETEEYDELWAGNHNHDYRISRDNSMVAFSTPGFEGGVVVLRTDDYSSVMFIPGAKHPAWLADAGNLILQDSSGQVVQVGVPGGETSILLPQGLYPRPDPNGTYLIYQLSSELTVGTELYSVALTGGMSKRHEELMGSDHTWLPTGRYFYCSKLVSGSFSDVLRFDPTDAEAVVTIQTAASEPSVGNEGSFMLVRHLSNDRSDGILYVPLPTGSTQRLTNSGIHPSANPVKESGLVELNEKVYLLTW